MNFDTLTEQVHKGFRVTLGAAASLLEAVQDPQKSSEKFSDIGTDFNRLTDELEVKGALTEKEARDFVKNFSAQFPNPFVPTSASSTTVNTVATPVVDAGIQAEIRALTEQLTTIRSEIEQLKAEKSQLS
jgi:polyhydroxyalkanoate synthesis regulator phasin